MKTYTVKEIREYTGLTRKQLFDYQKGIPPYDHMDNGDPLTDREGYKLYDQEGLNKLSLAALFKKLGKTPKYINDIFCSEEYDSGEVLSEIIREAKQKNQELEDIIIVSEYYKWVGISELTFNPFQINDLHKVANSIRRELKTEDFKYLKENLDDKNIKKLLRLFKEFEKFKGTDNESVKCDKQIKKIIYFFSDDLKVKNWARRLTALQSELTVSDISKFVDDHTYEGLSEYISHAIGEYQFNNLIDELDHAFGEKIEQLMLENYENSEVLQLFDYTWKLIKKWYGFIFISEAISMLQADYYIFDQFDDGKELSDICKYFFEGFKYYQNNKLID